MSYIKLTHTVKQSYLGSCGLVHVSQTRYVDAPGRSLVRSAMTPTIQLFPVYRHLSLVAHHSPLIYDILHPFPRAEMNVDAKMLRLLPLP